MLIVMTPRYAGTNIYLAEKIAFESYRFRQVKTLLQLNKSGKE